MSEKRFELTKINPTVNLSDTVYFIIDYENPNKEIRTLKDCVDLLNEQQSEINSLKIGLKLSSGEKLFSRRELERKVDEQQDTIRKLRNENIILKNKIEDLRVSLFMQDKELQKLMQKSDLDE